MPGGDIADPLARRVTIAAALKNARALAARGDDESAKREYVRLLHLDPTHAAGLNELGTLALASGHRAAARTAFAQAARCHPDDPVGLISLGNLLMEDGDFFEARRCYEAAVAADPKLPAAHQGMARVLAEFGDPAADFHWNKGFAGHAIVPKRYRGAGPGVPILLLVSARGGNIPTRHLIDDRVFAVTALYADFFDPAGPPPPHALAVNAIGDADLAGTALLGAEALLAGGTAPVINPPGRVRATGRVENARRLAELPGVIAPAIVSLSRSALRAAEGLNFPLLLRAPGFHTGRHFVHVASWDGLADAVAALPGEELLAIQYLDARGPDGHARKYRAMFVDGAVYPLHLAISSDWKVHYFSAAMAANAAHREEERRFLENMPGVLGARAMAALAGVGAKLGLDYAGIDFGLAANGSLLLFEANATMVVNPPEPDPIWDYRRSAIDAVLSAVDRMLLDRLKGADRTREM
jgi:hypothetical protein